MALDALIVGLGNPGPRYAATRHNAGFLVTDRLAERHGGSWRSKYNGRFCETDVAGFQVALLEPLEYMNLSGRSAGAAAAFYKLRRGQVIVVYDEIELSFNDVRPRNGGGLKGHNGLRSLAASLGGADFLRVRCGVGRPRSGDPRSVADFVLGAFYDDEDASALADRGADCVESLLRDGPPPP